MITTSADRYQQRRQQRQLDRPSFHLGQLNKMNVENVLWIEKLNNVKVEE